VGCLLASAYPQAQLLILLNGGIEALEFQLPDAGDPWRLLVDTALEPAVLGGHAITAPRVTLAGRSLQLLAAGAALSDPPLAGIENHGESR
jgi:pullulanase/glycogen debranching enzyme